MERNLDQVISNQFKSNDEVFRNTMERIFQTYSNLGDPGVNACLKTMTFKTEKGILPFNSAEAEHELRHLRSRVALEQLRVMDRSAEQNSLSEQDTDLSISQMAVPHRTMTDLDSSSQMENITDSLWSNSETFPNSTNRSNTFLGRPSQIEDEELEKTLSSHGTTLLDLYPSMINQINESCRRQRVTEAATAVRRRYRNKCWQSTKAQRGHLNNSHNCSFFTQKPSKSTTSHAKKKSNGQVVPTPRSKLDSSPLRSARNTSFGSNDRFYSPRRDDAEIRAPTGRGSPSTGTHLYSGTEHKSVRVLDLSTSSSASSSLSPDLNQTYTIPPQRSRDVLPFAICSPNYKQCKSPLKEPNASPVAGQECRHVSLPSSMSGLGREVFRDHLSSPNRFQKQAITGYSSGLRSPLKSQLMGLEQGQGSPATSYPRQIVRMNENSTAEVHRSPYQHQPSFCSQPHHVYSDQKENLALSLALKRQQSLSSQQPQVVNVSRMSSKRLDTEFTRLYHHFVCRNNSSGSASCHLCRMEKGVQNPTTSSISMSALALTPLRVKLKKRPRQPEVEESLRVKRFRESCSPLEPKQKQQQASRYVIPVIPESSEDKNTWNRALMLHCPSPGFLRKVTRPKLDQHCPAWRSPMSYAAAATSEARSPMRASNQRNTSLIPSLSRRRLLYGPLQ